MNKYPDKFLGCISDYNDARIVVFGAPFDSTTSFRSGTRLASRYMRTESIYGMETYSPYQDKDLEELNIHDWGDLELAFGNSERAVADIEKLVSEIIYDHKIPLMIGGEHLLTLGCVKAAHKAYDNLKVLQFDAHLDVRDEILGERLSHGTVMRRINELLDDKKIYQFCVRSGLREEFNWAEEHNNVVRYNLDGLENALNEIGNDPVYLTFDLDALDPSIMPGTGTPEAGGVNFNEIMRAISLIGKANIIGADIVELAPSLDLSGASTVLACKLLRELLISIY
ncbi:MAG: agmatinase [Christensenellales bacterium]|jgi:agmatinase